MYATPVARILPISTSCRLVLEFNTTSGVRADPRLKWLMYQLLWTGYGYPPPRPLNTTTGSVLALDPKPQAKRNTNAQHQRTTKSRRKPGTEPAVSVVLDRGGLSPALQHGTTFETPDLRLKVEVEARIPGWNRPHSRRSTWKPQAPWMMDSFLNY